MNTLNDKVDAPTLTSRSSDGNAARTSRWRTSEAEAAADAGAEASNVSRRAAPVSARSAKGRPARSRRQPSASTSPDA